MAITPISLFQSQGSGIAQFLQGGQNALASALNNVIQVGRDTANKQFAQERDFLGEQARVESLAQRRGEVAQQQANLDRSFAREMFVSDRNFADQNEDQAREEARMRANDLFAQRDADRKFRLQEQEAAGREELQGMQLDAARREQQFEEGLMQEFNFGEPQMSNEPGVLPPKPGDVNARTLYGPALPKSPEERLVEAEMAMEVSKGRDATAFARAAREKARIEAEIREAGGGTAAETPAEARARRSEERAIQRMEESRAEKENKKVVESLNREINVLLTNLRAFPPASSFVPEEGTLPEEEIERWQAEADQIDAGRRSVELQAALDSATVEDYVRKASPSSVWNPKTKRWDLLTEEEQLARAEALLGPEGVAERKRLYKRARELDSLTAPTSETSSQEAPASRTGSQVSDDIERYRQKLAD